MRWGYPVVAFQGKPYLVMSGKCWPCPDYNELIALFCYHFRGSLHYPSQPCATWSIFDEQQGGWGGRSVGEILME